MNIKIGVLNDQSGIYSDLSGVGSVVAAQMAVKDFGGASKGINVEVLAADHQNKPDVGSIIARDWIDQQDVDVITDVPGSAIALAVSDIAREKGRIHLNSGAGTAELTGARCSPTLSTEPMTPGRLPTERPAPWSSKPATAGSSFRQIMPLARRCSRMRPPWWNPRVARWSVP